MTHPNEVTKGLYEALKDALSMIDGCVSFGSHHSVYKQGLSAIRAYEQYPDPSDARLRLAFTLSMGKEPPVTYEAWLDMLDEQIKHDKERLAQTKEV